MAPRVTIIDDLASARHMLARSLAERYEVAAFASVERALEAARETPPDVVVSDVRMPGTTGLEGLRHFETRLPGVPVILLTAFGSVASAVEAMKGGAYDYLTKPCNTDELELVIRRALDHSRLRRENAELRRRMQVEWGGLELVGRSPPMRRVAEAVARVAPTRVPVLIEGASGTGKDLVARAIHAMSDRAGGPFLALNVAAIAESLAESELFGHERGAFSGAESARAGFFAEAAGGTLFLDEIAALPLALQPKLLRVLQDGEFIPVGSRQPRTTDARVICASNRDLVEAVERGEFREDLYYRICVVPLRLPPLVERREDIPALVAHLLAKHARTLDRPPLQPDRRTMQLLMEHDWPGNVRELEHVLEHALLFAGGSAIEPCDLPPAFRGRDGSCENYRGPYREAREAWEARYLAELLAAAGGQVSRAADLAGLHRSTLYEKLTRHGLLDGATD